MFKTYLKIAVRNLRRNKTNSFINIAGLSIGIACVVLIALFVMDEKKYDKHFTNADRIFQVNLDAVMGGQAAYVSNTPPAVGPALKRSFPEVETYTRFFVMGREVISTGGTQGEQKHFTENNFLAVDSNFLEVFDYAFATGDARSCFQEPHSIVLTETTAKKYFGNTQSAIGKNLVLDEYREPFRVTAVLKDLPAQSSIQFDLLIPTSACPPVKRFGWSWIWLQMNTYVLLNRTAAHDAQSLRTLESKFPEMVRTQAASAFKRVGQDFDAFIAKGGKWDFHLMPLTDVHLYSAGISSPFLSTLGDIKYIYIFSAIALFIMILACVNFMNLSTAQSARRAKEVGIRKVLGSQKKQLIRQFLSEAFLYSVISTVTGLFLVALLLPLFNNVSGKSLVFRSVFDSGAWLFIVALTIITALLAGSYPAFYLTRFNPVAVLKGNNLFSRGISSLIIRNGLVVFQFTVSIALIICTAIVFQQLKFARKLDMGLNKENVVIIPNAEKLDNTAEVFKQQLETVPGVSHVSITSSVPTQNAFGDFYAPDLTGVTEPLLAKDIALNSYMVDENFVPALGLRMVRGRNFSKAFNDSASVIVNEETVKQIGWKEPLGKFITYTSNGGQRFEVIGVVKNFNTESIRSAVGPFALFNHTSRSYRTNTKYIVAKISGDITGGLRQVESRWKALAPAIPFEYSFLDKNFESLYRAEQKQGTVFAIFTCLSIFVACLGLFGLTIYTAERRTKEIGIRKVLGASVPNLVQLLSKEFIKLVAISIVLAFPIGWWAMTKWLQDFNYHIKIGWMVFLLAGASALLIALLTVSMQAMRSATMNPVKSLRTE